MGTIEYELEADARWMARGSPAARVLAYGAIRDEAMSRAQVLALRVIAERLEIKGMTPREFRRHAGTRFGR